MGKHLVLLGDSIFDNDSYVDPDQAVIDQLRRNLTPHDQATLLARDGATTDWIPSQLEQIPESATHLFLSVGGNDALQVAPDLMRQECSTVEEALAHAHQTIREFHGRYLALIARLLQWNLPLSVLTIYDGVPNLDNARRAGLCLFNDVITRTACEFRLPTIDIRVICNEPHHYSLVSPIEPSESGGQAIVEAILQTTIDTGKPEPSA